jgi:hypothetical protein
MPPSPPLEQSGLRWWPGDLESNEFQEELLNGW